MTLKEYQDKVKEILVVEKGITNVKVVWDLMCCCHMAHEAGDSVEDYFNNWLAGMV
jgi:hypothetical protein